MRSINKMGNPFIQYFKTKNKSSFKRDYQTARFHHLSQTLHPIGKHSIFKPAATYIRRNKCSKDNVDAR